MEHSSIKIASILAPRHASTFFQSFIPQKRFCGIGKENEREYVEDVGYRFYYHLSYKNYASCRHRHRHIVSIRNPYEAALSFYYSFVKENECSLEEFLLEKDFPIFSNYVSGSIPEDYDVICNVDDIEESLRQINNVLNLKTNSTPRNVNKNRKHSSEYEENFQKRLAYNYDVYYNFLEEFNRRKSV